LFDDREISRQEAEAFITSSNESFANWGYGIWLCFEAEPSQFDQMPVGFAGLFAATSPTAPSLIFGMQPQRWGRGYAREATAAVIDHAFTSLGLGSVVADVDQPNLASIRVLEKLGMVEVRRAMVEERPLLYYEMLSQLV
jgi:RimJ/RimL family protein N-acetyltransferase